METPIADAVGYIEDSLSGLECAFNATGSLEDWPTASDLSEEIGKAIEILKSALTPEVLAQAEKEQREFDEADGQNDAQSY